jgi:hypothetical protein
MTQLDGDALVRFRLSNVLPIHINPLSQWVYRLKKGLNHLLPEKIPQNDLSAGQQPEWTFGMISDQIVFDIADKQKVQAPSPMKRVGDGPFSLN